MRLCWIEDDSSNSRALWLVFPVGRTHQEIAPIPCFVNHRLDNVARFSSTERETNLDALEECLWLFMR